jgi:osmotically-inducible protein OsmY
MKSSFLPVVTLAALMTLGPLAQATTMAVGRYDSQIQSRLAEKLAKDKDFRNVQSTVEDGIVTLTGTVENYKDKLDAGNQARKADHSQGVRNLIEVAGPSVTDAELQQKLAKKLRYDRVGYNDVAFNAITVKVNNGVVTLGGAAVDYPALNDAVSIVQNTAGVKDVVNGIRLLPMIENDLRFRVYRAIYRDNVLSKYAMDPARPIRIIVDGGNIGLYGQVDSQMDKTIAGMRAREVFGGFSVENHLTLPNQTAQ